MTRPLGCLANFVPRRSGHWRREGRHCRCLGVSPASLVWFKRASKTDAYSLGPIGVSLHLGGDTKRSQSCIVLIMSSSAVSSGLSSRAPRKCTPSMPSRPDSHSPSRSARRWKLLISRTRTSQRSSTRLSPRVWTVGPNPCHSPSRMESSQVITVCIDATTFHEPKTILHKVEKALMLETDVSETPNEVSTS